MMMLLFQLFIFIGCATEEAKCSDDTTCGFGEVCVEGTCTRNSCANSSQCEMEEYCAQGDCTAGCAADDDCYPGDICNLETSSCEKEFCTDSHVDCAFQEYCNSITGECVPASGYFCRECETDSDCGGGGNVCLSFGLQREFCGVQCEKKSDCPSGFECYEASDENGVSTKQCMTYCWLYIQDRPAIPGNPNSLLEEPFLDLNPECLEVRY